MAAIRPIDRTPPTSSDVEAAKKLAVNANSGIVVTGPAAPTNSLQNSGQSVSGAARLSGGKATASPPKTAP